MFDAKHNPNIHGLHDHRQTDCFQIKLTSTQHNDVEDGDSIEISGNIIPNGPKALTPGVAYFNSLVGCGSPWSQQLVNRELVALKASNHSHTKPQFTYVYTGASWKRNVVMMIVI